MKRISGTILMLAAAGLCVHAATAGTGQVAPKQQGEAATVPQPAEAIAVRAAAADAAVFADMRKSVVESPLKAVLASAGETEVVPVNTVPVAPETPTALSSDVDVAALKAASRNSTITTTGAAPRIGNLVREGMPRVDVGKSVVEIPLKSVLASTRDPEAASGDTIAEPASAPARPTPVAEVGPAPEPVRVPPRDRGKSLTERPLKSVLAGTRNTEPAAADAPAPVTPPQPAPPSASGAGSVSPPPRAPTSTTADNPAVPPGNVRWHDSFDAARAAARHSGKPVLLFQMIGRLDQRFT